MNEYTHDFTFNLGSFGNSAKIKLSRDFSYLLICDSERLELYGWDVDTYKIRYQYPMNKGFYYNLQSASFSNDGYMIAFGAMITSIDSSSYKNVTIVLEYVPELDTFMQVAEVKTITPL